MLVSDFDFSLPEGLIALRPAPGRSEARLMTLIAGTDGPVHGVFSDIASYLDPGTLLILNNTKVIPARLYGRKENGNPIDMLLVREIAPQTWEVLSRGGYTGNVSVSERMTIHMQGGRTACLEYEGDLRDILDLDGEMPLPPYIRRQPDELDKERYQTVYATDPGSIAAPTAGLHFTGPLLDALADHGVIIRRLTLHVGLGTFMPVRSERVDEHEMPSERFTITKSLLSDITRARAEGRRVVACGTTTTRAIEGLLSGQCKIQGEDEHHIVGETDIFIRPGYRFRAIDALITNFHLPRSTPLMLAGAMAGRERLLGAYAEAIGLKYRFFSYGDAMLIL